MKLDLIRHLWGVTDAWEQSFARAASEGFTGIECALPAQSDLPRFRALLDSHSFSYIAQIFTAGSDVDAHLHSFEEQVAAALLFKPRLINAHSGSDSWSAREAQCFFSAALRIEAACGTPVAHETHRGRVMYNPWTTRDLLIAVPGLKLTCDFSHWVCVAERLLDGEWPILRQCAAHAVHIHARVGYEEGPQVPDPRVPEYRRHLEAHERWWDLVWDYQASDGHEVSTLTPEFGPPDYLHTLPGSQIPVADLGDICAWQAHRQADRFGRGAWRGAFARPEAPP